ncbi:DUF3885 domain-containing protein [Niabella aurantiaca]|uniref:DUF3885 domain-containing protein n=1 Tax=Niabella aurantiaca TaxID=379900 RepID=UPI0003728224|nr:hypothetical protein [Niabella aurantiaca]
MTKEQFDIFWKTNYPGTIPISHCFKYDFPERWLRIHSLPESKRYPETQEEWEILLSRQNKIINDLLGYKTTILVVIGEYFFEGQEPYDILESEYSLEDCSLVSLNPIDLHKLWPDEHDKGQLFIAKFCQQVWIPKRFDKLLKDIAQYYLRAFFVSLENKYIIAPYDGGMDIILNDTKTRDHYKEKYKLWLSPRSDGF